MSDNEKLPIPDWFDKEREAIKLPNGTVIKFTGKEDNKIIVTKEGDTIHGTFVIRDYEYDFHLTKEIGNKKIYQPFFKLHRDFVMDMIKVNIKNNQHMIDQQPINSWLTNKSDFILNLHDTRYPEIERHDDFFDISPENVIKLALDKKRVLRTMFKIGALYQRDGKCKGMIMPNQKNGTFVIVSRNFIDLILDACIGMAWLKGTFPVRYNKLAINNKKQ